MYDFIYFFIYKHALKRNPNPKFAAAGFVFLVISFHILFILTVIRKLFNVYFSGFSDSYYINKMCMMPFIIAFLILVHYIFKRRFKKIERKYEWRNMLTFWNTVIVFSIMLIPLFAVIMMLQ